MSRYSLCLIINSNVLFLLSLTLLINAFFNKDNFIRIAIPKEWYQNNHIQNIFSLHSDFYLD